jgi:hypothetical protein
MDETHQRRYQRRHPRARDLSINARLIAGRWSGPCTIENLSAGGASLVTELWLASGEEVELVLDLLGARLTLPAKVYRIDVRPDLPLAVALAFRDLAGDVQRQLSDYVLQEIELCRARSPETVVLVNVSLEHCAHLVRDLAVLGRSMMIARGPLEATWYLQDRGYNIETIILDIDDDAPTTNEFLARIAQAHPQVRRIGLSAQASQAIEPSLLARTHGVLSKHGNRDDLEAALGAAVTRPKP